MSNIPCSYQEAEWRNTTPIDPNTQRIGLGFNVSNGGVVRFCISMESAKLLVESIHDFINSHSPISSEIPSSLGSMPFDGEKV